MKARIRTNAPNLLLVFVTCFLVFAAFRYGQSDTIEVVNSPEIEKAEHNKRDESDHMHLRRISIISPRQPRAFLWHGFLTPEECEEIKTMASSHLQRSMVVGANGSAVFASARTSKGTWSIDNNHPAVKKASKQIAEWSHLPESYREGFYVIKYEVGEEYKPHYDSFDDTPQGRQYQGPQGNRICTALIYLHTPIRGGETIFPRYNHPDGPLEVKAVQGDAILFWDYSTEFKVDPFSLHGGKPVLEGEKWSMTGWIRMGKND